MTIGRRPPHLARDDARTPIAPPHALAPACSTPATRRPPPISVIPSSAVGAPHSHPLSLSLCPMTAIPSSLTTHYGRFLAATHSLTTPVTPPATFNMDNNRKEYQDRLIVCSQRIIERAKFYTATLPSGFMRSSSHTRTLTLLATLVLAHTISHALFRTLAPSFTHS